ncbi:hypothetical protein LR48_Vigan07g185200 [Vigna angularis]|uniref:Uncharacterized protein n=1 Tax=Phaseolus angularis TaxID=3914 RepID=A0A0L9UZE0_PHAAN|nr:hypothetical protein LR48_Vigan07g185200 [Vigna angularis]
MTPVTFAYRSQFYNRGVYRRAIWGFTTRTATYQKYTTQKLHPTFIAQYTTSTKDIINKREVSRRPSRLKVVSRAPDRDGTEGGGDLVAVGGETRDGGRGGGNPLVVGGETPMVAEAKEMNSRDLGLRDLGLRDLEWWMKPYFRQRQQ